MPRRVEEVYDRRFTSGSCEKVQSAVGATEDSGTSDYEKKEKALCKNIMKSADTLRVWLAIEHHVKLSNDGWNDLYTYMTIHSMCVSDPGFEKALALFKPPPPHQDTLSEKMTNIMFLVIHLLYKNVHVLMVVATFFAPVLLPIALPWVQEGLGLLEKRAPTIKTCVEAKLPQKLLKKAD